MRIIFILPKRLKKTQNNKNIATWDQTFTLSAEQVIFYIMILCTLNLILIRYKENPMPQPLKLRQNLSFSDHAILLYLIDGINATIWIDRDQPWVQSLYFDNTCFNSEKKVFLKMAQSRV